MNNQDNVASDRRYDSECVRLDIKSPDALLNEANTLKSETFRHIVPNFNCPICYEDKLECVSSPACSHETCLSCMFDYLQAKIEDNKIIDIKCPFEGCSQLLSDSFIKDVLDAPTYEKYSTHKEIKLLARNPNTRYCPNPLCSKPFIPNLQNPSTLCQCKTVICHKCWQPWHEGKPCSQEADQALKAVLNDLDIRLCIICKTPAQKNGGCPIMVCPVCDYHWCWRCGRHYQVGHEFICKRKWDPIHPNEEDKSLGAKIKQTFVKFLGVMTHVLMTIFMPILAILFWPLMTIFAAKISRKRPGLFLLLLLANFLLAAVTLPFTIVMVLGVTIWQFCKYQLPWVFYCLTCKCIREESVYRWKKASKQENFEYTNKHAFPHAMALACIFFVYSCISIIMFVNCIINNSNMCCKLKFL